LNRREVVFNQTFDPSTGSIAHIAVILVAFGEVGKAFNILLRGYGVLPSLMDNDTVRFKFGELGKLVEKRGFALGKGVGSVHV